jgi:putative ABC transport system permease protein
MLQRHTRQRGKRFLRWRVSTLCDDVRYGLRVLTKNPGFTTAVAVILVVGISANTAVFSIINAVLLRPLPYRDPGRIVIPWERDKEGIEFKTSARNFLFVRGQSSVFDSLAAERRRRFYVTGIDKPQEVSAMAVSPSLFPLLGIAPSLGRSLLPEEERAENSRVLVLSHAFWANHLGGDPAIVGKTLVLDGNLFRVTGVMPSTFEFPFGRPIAFWVPLVVEEGEQALPMRMIARLQKGVTLEQARAEMAVIAGRLQEIDPGANSGHTFNVDRLLDRMLGGNRRLLLLLMGAAGFVLLISCCNAANLFLARAATRQREMATRVALGASRGHIIRQMLTESLLLSIGAGLLGLLLTLLTIKALVRLCPADIPRLKDVGVDWQVLVFAVGASVLIGLIFGATPAWRFSDACVSPALRERSGPSGTGRNWRRLHSGLVISQISLSLILFVGAVLLIRTLVILQTVDLGFRPDSVLAMRIDLPRAKYPEAHLCHAFFQTLLQRVRTLPQVRSAALVCPGLDWGAEGAYMDVLLDDRPAPGPGEQRYAKQMSVSSGYFEAMGIRVLRGRTFTDDDIQRVAAGGVTRGGVVIDENLARKYFPDVDPIGRRVWFAPIIGVVSTVRDFEVLAPVHDTFYMPLAPSRSYQTMDIVVRTDGPPQELAAALRAQVAALDKDEPISRLQTLDEALAGMLAPRRFVMVLLSLFTGIALILAAVGVYGLLQYTTTQATHDIGIQMALGARQIDILCSVLKRGLRLALIGLVIGLAGVLLLGRLLVSLLYDVTTTDPLTLVSASTMLTGILVLASYLPARRAAKVDPMVALRSE